jgi:hypothetical protein
MLLIIRLILPSRVLARLVRHRGISPRLVLDILVRSQSWRGRCNGACEVQMVSCEVFFCTQMEIYISKYLSESVLATKIQLFFFEIFN